MITAGIIGFAILVISGEMLLLFELLEEVGMLAFEWGHKSLDLLYADVFGLKEEASQKASAWTGLFLIIILLGWGCYVLRLKYLQAKAAAPQWWADRKAEWKAWWAVLPWFTKLAYILGYFGLLGILAMFI